MLARGEVEGFAGEAGFAATIPGADFTFEGEADDGRGEERRRE